MFSFNFFNFFSYHVYLLFYFILFPTVYIICNFLTKLGIQYNFNNFIFPVRGLVVPNSGSQVQHNDA
jgi:hypothetical protein